MIHHLLPSELRKLTSTRLPWAFAAVLLVLAATNGVAVAFGTDMDGSKTFISTAEDQQSLMAFGANAFIIAALFGSAIAARVFAHKTVIAMYLAEPHRARALGAQFAAIAIGGAAIGVVGTGLTVIGVAAALPMTDFGFLVSFAGVAEIVVAAGWAGAAGAVFGGAIGAVVRNTGGAVTGTVLALVIAPPLVVQLASGVATWIPTSLTLVVSGVASDTGLFSAVVAIALWAAVPAALALWSVERRDVV